MNDDPEETMEDTKDSVANRKAGWIEKIVHGMLREHSTAVVLYHHAVAEHLGIGPAEHKCLDLLRDRHTMTSTELCAATGLTSGAMTGIITRLERSGFVRRDPDAQDRRKQIISLATERSPFHDVIEPLRRDMTTLLESFREDELSAIAAFLAGSTDLVHRHTGLLRAIALSEAARPLSRSREERSGHTVWEEEGTAC